MFEEAEGGTEMAATVVYEGLGGLEGLIRCTSKGWESHSQLGTGSANALSLIHI